MLDCVSADRIWPILPFTQFWTDEGIQIMRKLIYPWFLYTYLYLDLFSPYLLHGALNGQMNTFTLVLGCEMSINAFLYMCSLPRSDCMVVFWLQSWPMCCLVCPCMCFSFIRPADEVVMPLWMCCWKQWEEVARGKNGTILALSIFPPLFLHPVPLLKYATSRFPVSFPFSSPLPQDTALGYCSNNIGSLDSASHCLWSVMPPLYMLDFLLLNLRRHIAHMYFAAGLRIAFWTLFVTDYK